MTIRASSLTVLHDWRRLPEAAREAEETFGANRLPRQDGDQVLVQRTLDGVEETIVEKTQIEVLDLATLESLSPEMVLDGYPPSWPSHVASVFGVVSRREPGAIDPGIRSASQIGRAHV